MHILFQTQIFLTSWIGDIIRTDSIYIIEDFIMSQIPKVKSSIPKPSLSQVATATGSQLDLLAGKNNPDRSLSR